MDEAIKQIGERLKGLRSTLQTSQGWVEISNLVLQGSEVATYTVAEITDVISPTEMASELRFIIILL